MSIFHRLSRLPRYGLVCNRSLLQTMHMSTKPEAAAAHVGRKGHRSVTKSKRTKLSAAFPDSFLKTNYIKPEKLSPLPPQYSSFIPDHISLELTHVARSGLARKGIIATYNHTDHIAISMPNTGSCYLLDHMVHRMASEVNADLLTLDHQDFISLAQHGFNRDAATLLPMLSAMDPDANALLALRPTIGANSRKNESSEGDVIDSATKSGTVELSKRDDEDDLHEDDDDEDISDQEEDDKLKINVHNKTVELDLDNLFDAEDNDLNTKDNSEIAKVSKSVLSQVSAKYTQMFKRLLAMENKSEEQKMIYLRDFGDMHDVFTRIMLKSLVQAVEELKQKGNRLMIVASHTGTQTKSEFIPVISNMRRISILPKIENEAALKEWNAVMKQDEARRITEVNAKQLIAMYSQKNPVDIQATKEDLLEQLTTINNISKTIWAPSEVDRRVATAIGNALSQKKSELSFDDFKQAHDMIEKSNLLEETTWNMLKSQKSIAKIKTDGSLDMDALKRSCNDYEKKLLSRVVDPFKVQGSFKDVRAPAMTIESLQSLISLPLQRPDLFQRGILRKNFIPGVLLFGPPGTGKTMLAKAVAKDSGSRMLDIQASDVYDMYVGQGEKNVKAVFSLARKLSPCVVFIDEVDSLMNKRGSDYSSKSHREIINQFMVEWDGLSSNNQGVIVMAATNRPFDLDDAVLRRMPRRILVDLPTEQDRVEILKILLKDETLAHDGMIEEIAKKTEHYSGSDLKNVCVTAALRVVQEQVRSTLQVTLNRQHFTEALKMVPPSSSEEMDSIVEIRKWDSKFGDGKKKKKSSIGFQ